MNMGGLYADVGDHEAIAITKDLFLLIIQDALGPLRGTAAELLLLLQPLDCVVMPSVSISH